MTTAELTREWVHDGETPDLITILLATEIAMSSRAIIPPLETATHADQGDEAEQIVEAFKDWLAGDSLDWDAVERRDAWTD